MKAVILAGGLGTRISEESVSRPKPMIEIGGKPILWHIMKIYSHYGINDFIVCCGYRGYMIKEYFANYFLHMSDVTFDMQKNSMEVHQRFAEPWKVTLVDTGENTMTGGRLKRVAEYVKNEEAFCFTYGDGVSNVNITESIAFHRKHSKLATLTAVAPKSRYGALSFSENYIEEFSEKPENMEGLVNGGFFVVSIDALSYIDGDNLSWEGTVLPRLARERQLVAYKHDGFWQSMDTLRDKEYLQSLWDTGNAPWKNWLD
jgi:glucose-1-phosphate cytidylyltransferase